MAPPIGPCHYLPATPPAVSLGLGFWRHHTCTCTCASRLCRFQTLHPDDLHPAPQPEPPRSGPRHVRHVQHVDTIEGCRCCPTEHRNPSLVAVDANRGILAKGTQQSPSSPVVVSAAWGRWFPTRMPTTYSKMYIYYIIPCPLPGNIISYQFSMHHYIIL